MAKEKRVYRVLAWGDAGTCATGFGTVMRHVLKGLAESGRFVIEQIGINFMGDFYDTDVHPYRLYPACPLGENDMFGRPRLIRTLLGNDPALRPPWDILFTLQDPFIVEPIAPQVKEIQKQYEEKGLPLVWVGYFPVDSRLKENWVTSSILAPDVSVVYTDWGKAQVVYHDLKGELKAEERVRVIPHGVDLDVFKPLPKQEIAKFRHDYFQGKVRDETYLVTNVNRNQPRKDVPRTFKVFKEFQKVRPDFFLYMHMAAQDAGGSLLETARQFDLKPGEDWGFPAKFNVNQGVPISVLNMIYNASDVIVSTTLGEGWGLSLTEAMAAGTLVAAPHNTSIPGILGNEGIDDHERGISVLCDSTSSEWICEGLADHERIRPLANVDDFVKKLVWAYDHSEECEAIVKRAAEWVKGLDWNKVVKTHWLPLFDQAASELVKKRDEAQARIRTNRVANEAVRGG